MHEILPWYQSLFFGVFSFFLIIRTYALVGRIFAHECVPGNKCGYSGCQYNTSYLEGDQS